MQDVQYADIDHMDERRDFTIDNVNFNGLTDYFHQLRQGGMSTIIIIVRPFRFEKKFYPRYFGVVVVVVVVSIAL